MIYGSVCSGIEAATVAWRPLGWKAAFFSEIEPFPRAVLQHHYPDVRLLGDFTKEIHHDSIDLLVGGTPCQSFSNAGQRGGLDDPRGHLMLAFGQLAQRLRPRWLVWENVPGVLSSNLGFDFGTFLGMLAQFRYGFAYRVCDAQYFGVPQRRRRVFVVGHLGNWRRAAAVLFERQSMSRHSETCDETRHETAANIKSCANNGSRSGLIAGSCIHVSGIPTEALFSATVTSKWAKGSGGYSGDECQNLIAFHGTQDPVSGSVASTLGRNNGQEVCFTHRSTVRRITPLEAERLQGFPDGYTAIQYRGKTAADAPRYKALGNSMAVPVMRWIGERIQMVDSIC